MSKKDSQNISSIRETNNEMLEYFNKLYIEYLDSIQVLKTELFEITIKLDELIKTKGIYVFGSQSRKNVFSPYSIDKVETNKEAEINKQIDELTTRKSKITSDLSDLEAKLSFVNRKLKSLESSNLSIEAVSKSYKKYLDQSSVSEDRIKTLEEEKEALEIQLKELKKETVHVTDVYAHGNSILNINAFNNTYYATILDKKIKDAILVNSRKLTDSYSLIYGNPDKAKALLAEILTANKESISYIDLLLSKMNYGFDSKKSVREIIDSLILEFRESHPECVIEPDIDLTGLDFQLDYIYGLSLYRLLNIFFDNIFKHSNANRVVFNLKINRECIEMQIIDNGIGIPANFLEKSPWYSSLHDAYDIVYLLAGSLAINKCDGLGTKVNMYISFR